MLTHALIALAALGPTDSPIEPIPVALVELGLRTEAAAPLCASYGELLPLFTFVFDGDEPLATLYVDAFFIDTFEQGMAEPGEAASLTLEAREVFMDFLHGCAL